MYILSWNAKPKRYPENPLTKKKTNLIVPGIQSKKIWASCEINKKPVKLIKRSFLRLVLTKCNIPSDKHQLKKVGWQIIFQKQLCLFWYHLLTEIATRKSTSFIWGILSSIRNEKASDLLHSTIRCIFYLTGRSEQMGKTKNTTVF